MLVKDVNGKIFEISENEEFRIAKQADIDNICSIIKNRFDEENREYTQIELCDLALKIQKEMENSNALSEVWDETFQYFFDELS